ncbi:MAG: glucosyl-3-phosphoglycerate synthase [Actinomycetota bacterium]
MSFPHPEMPRFDRPPPADRLFDHERFDPDELAERKGPTTVTVAIPARDEAATIGPIVATIRRALMEDAPLVDELLVIDDLSTDDTALIAEKAGATVWSSAEILPEHGSGGKGEALWKSLSVATGDLITWCDADIRNFDERFVVGCIGPMLVDETIGFVKGFYRRPLSEDGEGGGRVTELMARPLIATLFPHLDHLFQPLSGEFGGRRALLQQVPFHRGYAVDLGLLIDLTARFGPDIVAQVDLGSRVHRNRPLRQLGPQASAILAMALERAGVTPVTDRPVLRRPEFGDAEISIGQLPPLQALAEG